MHKVTTIRFADMPGVAVDRYDCAPGKPEGVDRHAHAEFQICWAVGVACSYNYRGVRHGVPRGAICVVHPEEIHTTSDAEEREPGATYHMLYLGPAVIQAVAVELAGGAPGVPFVGDPVLTDDASAVAIRSLILALERNADRLVRDVLCLAACAQLVRRHGWTCATPSGRVSARPEVLRARDFLHAHTERPVSLAELASVVGLSPYHLCRVFKQELHLAPHAYHLRVRVAAARALLVTGSTPSEAATATGFYDQSQLGRHFRRFTGTTPSRYGSPARIA